MNDKQKQAYEWAKNQKYTSVAADYARELVGVVDELQSELSEVKAERDAAVADLAKTRNCSTCKRKMRCPFNRMGLKTPTGRYSFKCWSWQGVQPERKGK